MNKSSSTPGGMHTGLKIAAGAFLLALSSCGRLINAAQRDIRVVSHPPIASADLVIYNGNLAAGWADWSWAPHNFHSRAELFGGQPCLEMIPGHFQGLYFHRSPFSTSGYSGIMFNINGGVTGGQALNIAAVDANKKVLRQVALAQFITGGKVPKKGWAFVYVPLSSLIKPGSEISGLVIQEAAGVNQPPVYFADIRILGTKLPTQKSYSIAMNTTMDRHWISPYIYGMANASTQMMQQLRVTVNRWGGNPSTTYNWVRGNCWNAGRDWYFRNGDYGHTSLKDRLPSGVADQFVSANKANGVASLITIPTIGYVARNDNNGTESVGVPSQGGDPIAPGSEAIPGYNPALNQQRVYVRSFARKTGALRYSPSPNARAVYQDEWVYHLVKKFGDAAHGGVKFYAMDNEPDLWDSEHSDIHPVRMSYDEMLANFLEYATAVKSADPTAMITGPVLSGWTAYWYSSRDRGSDNFRTHTDRTAHGGIPFLKWWLGQVHRHDLRTGKRTLNVLDIHYYPQENGVYAGRTDPQTDALRLRSTRSLWDPTYIDESWINDDVDLIPRMKRWIAEDYPGTKLGITEWNWGADGTMNGALAIAEVLGIFGREGVYLANYWTSPRLGSPGAFAFKMYRNVDGNGEGFGNLSVFAHSSAPSDISCFASIDSKSKELVAIIINKRPDVAIKSSLRVAGGVYHRVSIYRYSSDHLGGIQKLPSRMLYGPMSEWVFPPYSITMLRFKP